MLFFPQSPNIITDMLPFHQDLFSAVVLQQQILTHELVLAASREAIRRSETDAQQLYQNAGQALDVLCSECVSVAKQDLIVPTVFAISQRALDQSDLLLVKRYMICFTPRFNARLIVEF